MTTLTPFDDDYIAPEPKAEEVKAAAPEPARRKKVDTGPKVTAAPRAAPVADDDAPQAAPLATEVEDGIYFGMSDEQYHAIQRLGSSGVSAIRVSPATFWEKSWFNPKKAEHDADSTPAQVLGRAYHCARLEPARFPLSYARGLNRADHPTKGAVYTGTDIEKALGEAGEPKTKAGEKVLDKAIRLAETGFMGTIWPIVEADFEASLNGRVPLRFDIFDDLVEDMERIRKLPSIASKLEGGAAEVSVFWTDEAGIKCKVRFDYLTVPHWVDFKTFANPNGKHLMQAVNSACQFNRYYIQAVWYRQASELLRAGALPIIGAATDAERELVAAIAERPDDQDCWYIFQEKGGIPNIIGKRFPFYDVPLSVKMQHAGATAEQIATVEGATRQITGIHYKGLAEINAARRTFLDHVEIYEPGEPWLPFDPCSDWEDADFPPRWLEDVN